MKQIILLAFLLVIVGTLIGQAQDKWELKKNEDGIAVYTRQLATGKLKEIRVVCELEATLPQLTSVLQDVNNHKTWVYSTRKSNLVKKINSQTLIYYSESDMPWPVTDRDLVVELFINPEPQNQQYIIQAKGIPDYLPPKPGLVRVPYSLALWKITPVAGKLKVDYTFSVDPGGSVPAWLVNTTAAIGPFNSFVKLREILKSRNAK
jgi:type II secretory pathway pseudopilin PulG